MNRGLRAKLDSVPARPGAYVFKNQNGEVIYVGKAKSLRDRMRSYFQSAEAGDYRGQALRREISDFEATVCASEVDALILEAGLIKKHKPRYNVELRDDKSYPYIAVTISDEYPRAILMRGKRVPGTVYYGPYVNAGAAKRTLQSLHKVFPIRQCRGRKPGRRGGSPCLYYDMRMCLGPCTGEVDPEEYSNTVRSFCDFLEGRYEKVLDDLESRMERAAMCQEYEQAAKLRNQIESARDVLRQRSGASSSMADYDVIGIRHDEMMASFVVAQHRRGTHLGNLGFFSDLEEERTVESLIAEFIERYYENASSIPEQVLVPREPAEKQALGEWLSGQRGKRVEIKVPKKGKKKHEMELAATNARLALEGAKMDRARDRQKSEMAVKELAVYLRLERYPLRIECYDISTTGGTAPVASMVAFQDGYPDRKSYRKFSMKFTAGIDDVAMMKEVLYRRFKRLSGKLSGEKEEEVGAFARSPDLVLLDGGKGQLNAGVEVLSVLGLDGIEVASLAKRFEEVYRPGGSEPIRIPRNSEALFLLQRLRDEAHRVAVSYHRSLMEKRTSDSWLDGIAGVGPKRKRALVRHFGSPKKLFSATLSEIKEAPGIPEAVAESIYQAAQRKERNG